MTDQLEMQNEKRVFGQQNVQNCISDISETKNDGQSEWVRR